MSSDIYERQREYQEANRRKYDAARDARLAQESLTHPFEPASFTAPRRPPAHPSPTPEEARLRESSHRHVERQRRARSSRAPSPPEREAEPPSALPAAVNAADADWPRDAVPLERYDDESFYEQLQRERREWAGERGRLIRVIELQQVELGKRSAAVTQQAATIASSFAESVVAFEERLVQLESTVASELRMLRQRGGGLGGSTKL